VGRFAHPWQSPAGRPPAGDRPANLRLKLRDLGLSAPRPAGAEEDGPV
jgi:hypothetical protein